MIKQVSLFVKDNLFGNSFIPSIISVGLGIVAIIFIQNFISDKLDGENQEREIKKTNNEFSTPTTITSEDATVGNSTFIVENNNTKEKNDRTNKVNETFVLDNPTQLNTERNNQETTFVYREQKNVKVNPMSEKKTVKAGNIGSVLKKTVFSPYENSPVKQKVEAFEKLKERKIPVMSQVKNTRLKTKQVLFYFVFIHIYAICDNYFYNVLLFYFLNRYVDVIRGYVLSTVQIQSLS